MSNDNLLEENEKSEIKNEEVRNLGFNTELDEANYSATDEQVIPNITNALMMLSDYLRIALPRIGETVIGISHVIADSFVVALNRLDNYLSKEFVTNLYDLLTKFPDSSEKLEKELLDTLYDSKWFQGCIVYIDINKFEEYFNILEHTRNGSRNRTKRIDKFIISNINKQVIEKIRKSWNTKGLDTYILRICNQAVYAYHRKEYALTVITLSSLWQGIIAEKSNHTNVYRKDNNTKSDFKQLSCDDETYSRASDFFDNYIMYPCASKDDVIEDVPGRHSALHSWHTRYPTKKAALNAILFTDYLIKLKPLSAN